jgi:hypothetical protein
VALLAARLCPAVLSLACDLAGSGVAASAAAVVDGEPPVKLKDVPNIMRPFHRSPFLCVCVCGCAGRWGGEILCVVGGGLLPYFA